MTPGKTIEINIDTDQRHVWGQRSILILYNTKEFALCVELGDPFYYANQIFLYRSHYLDELKQFYEVQHY